MYYTYLLENNLGELYIGQTNDKDPRLKRHNSNKVRSTKNRGPWKIIYAKEFSTRSESMQYETYLKSFKNAKYVKEIVAQE